MTLLSVGCAMMSTLIDRNELHWHCVYNPEEFSSHKTQKTFDLGLRSKKSNDVVFGFHVISHSM